MNRNTIHENETFECIRCGHQMPLTASACPECGLPVHPEEDAAVEYRCPKCGADVFIGDVICSECGTDLMENLRRAYWRPTDSLEDDPSAQSAADDSEYEYTCSDCGAVVAEADRICPNCGANIEEVEDVPGSPEDPRIQTDPDESDPEEPADFEYTCTVCGGVVGEKDQFCRHCGENIEEIEDDSDELDVSQGGAVLGQPDFGLATDNGYHCSACGARVREEDRFCPNCGENIEEVEEVAGRDFASVEHQIVHSQDRTGEEFEYTCSSCGNVVDETDQVCPYCGEDLEEIIEEKASTNNVPIKNGRNYSKMELDFYAEATSLPAEYRAYFVPGSREELVVPARHVRVGNLRVRFVFREILVAIGTHTEKRFPNPKDAVTFIQDVLTDRVVFHFSGKTVALYNGENFSRGSQIDENYYVWSGLLREKLTGADWYQFR